jgi:thiamine-phosphate pyrophosphorylase
MLVTDRRLAGDERALVRAVAAAVEGGVNAVQLREKDLGTRPLARLAGALREAIAGGALLIVNGNAEVAAGADGLHLPEDAPYERPEGRLVGRSVHSVAAAVSAAREGADYVIIGPIYETPSHPGHSPGGPKLIADVANAVGVPVIAIGGVTAERAREVMTAGASGVAVVSAILGAPSPREAAAALWEALTSVPAAER